MVSSPSRGGRTSVKREMGELIKFGLAIFVLFALVTGFFYGLLLLMFDPQSLSTFSALFLGMLGYVIILFSAPVIALFLGIRMGRHVVNPKASAIAGLMTGGVGHILLWAILIFFMQIFTPDLGGGAAASPDASSSIIPYIVMVFPTAIAGCIGGYFSTKLEGEGNEGTLVPGRSDFSPSVKSITKEKEKEDSFDEKELVAEDSDVKLEECPECEKKGLRVYPDQSAYCENCGHTSQSFQTEDARILP